MSIVYCRSAAVGTGTGASWANATTKLTSAFAVALAGDTIVVADDHAETTAAGITLTGSNNAANPIMVVCVNTHVTQPPTGLATSAAVNTTGASSIAFAGFAYYYGITFTCGDAGNTASFTFITSGVNTFDSCAFVLGNTSTSSRMTIGLSAREIKVTLNNTSVKFGATAQTFNCTGTARLLWINTPSAVDVAGSVPTVLITPAVGFAGYLLFSGVDLSGLGANTLCALGGAGTAISASLFTLSNCKLGGSTVVISGIVHSPGGIEVFLDNCDSGNTNYRMEHYKFQGSIVTETTDVKTNGASNGTTGVSHKFVSLTARPSLFAPLEGPWMYAWNETTGSSLTAAVDFLHDSLTNLTNADIYLEVEYLGTSGFPESVYSNNRVASSLAAALDCPASSAAWTTTGITNPNKQQLQVAFVPQVKGPVRMRVCLAKSNYTVYVDPMPSGLKTPSREYLLPGTGAFLNDTGPAAVLSRVRTGF